MNKILLSFLAGVSLFNISAFAMEPDESLALQHPSAKKRTEETMVVPCPQTEEPFNFVALSTDLQSHTLLFIFDQKDLLSMTSTCISVRTMGEKKFDNIWLQNRLFSIMPAVLPTAHGSTKVYLTMEWGLCLLNEDYLMWGKLIKEILKKVDDNPSNTFELHHPDYDQTLHAPNFPPFYCVQYKILNHENLAKYQQIRENELFTAISCNPDKTTLSSKWHIQGIYPSGEKFSLNIFNTVVDVVNAFAKNTFTKSLP